MFHHSFRAAKGIFIYSSRYFFKCVLPQRSGYVFPMNSIVNKNLQTQITCSTGLLTPTINFKRNIHVVHMRGLDWEATEQDVIDFFKPLDIKPSKISLRCDISGRTGLCEVEFATHGEAVTAMRKRHAFIGNRFIRLSLKSDPETPEKDPDNSIDKNDLQLEESTGINGNTGEKPAIKNVIRMRNLPTRLTEQAIFQFFWPLKVTPISVQAVHDDNGYRTGEFDVEFLTNEDTMRAMTKNNTLIGHRCVELVSLDKSFVPNTPEYQETTNASYSNNFGQNYSSLSYKN